MASGIRIWQRYPRSLAAAILLTILVGLFVAGTRPFAANLIPSPWDKLAHVMTFTIITTVIGAMIGLRTSGVVLISVAAALAIGAIDELQQAVVIGRNAGWDDFTADAIGALLGAMLVRRLQQRSGKYPVRRRTPGDRMQ